MSRARVAKLSLVVLLCITSGLTVLSIYTTAHRGDWSSDYYGTMWRAGNDVLAGENPYPDPTGYLGNPAVYPPAVILAGSPLSLLPFDVAAALWTAILAIAAALVLPVMRIRSRWAWWLWLSSWPVITGIMWGNLIVLVVLACACTWRWRDRPAVAAAGLTFGIVAKLFVWPLWFWLLATRRWRAAAYTAVGSSVLILGSWAIIGFDGFLGYPALLNHVATTQGEQGNLIYSLAQRLELGPTVGRVACALAGAAALAAMFVARRDRTRFSLAIATALAATPLAWSYYLMFLGLLPGVWISYGLLWLTPPTASDPLAAGPVAGSVVLATICVLLAVRPSGWDLERVSRSALLRRGVRRAELGSAEGT